MKKSIKTVPKHSGAKKWLDVIYDGELAGYFEIGHDGVWRFEACKDCRYGVVSLMKISNALKRLRGKDLKIPAKKKKLDLTKKKPYFCSTDKSVSVGDASDWKKTTKLEISIFDKKPLLDLSEGV